jgi:hypothetical protein
VHSPSIAASWMSSSLSLSPSSGITGRQSLGGMADQQGRSLPYSAFDKLQRVSHAAIVENKRLGEILAWIKEQQDRQPGLNTIPKGPRRSSQGSGLLKNRALRMAEVAKSNSKAPRQGRHRSDMVVSAAPAHAPSEAVE